MNDRSWRVRRLCVIAVLCAMAYVAVAIIRIPVVAFLKYEPKDVLLVMGGFMFGPLVGALMGVTVGLLELVTVSDTGFIGLIMNVISTCLFVCTASAIYQRKKNIFGAVSGLVVGILLMTAGMLLWNYLITPLYLEISREAVTQMLLPVFLPFNLFKGTLNAAFAMLLYKPLRSALRATRLMPPASTEQTNKRNYVWLVALFIIAALIGILQLWAG